MFKKMDDSQIIDHYFQEAVTGLNEVVLMDFYLWYSHIINLQPQLQAVYVIGVLDKQVLNGGFHQYFFNGYGMFVDLAIWHLITVKADNTARIVKNAYDLVNAENQEIETFRQKCYNRQLDRIVSFDKRLLRKLDELDSQYYKFEDDLPTLLAEYLRTR